jgi:hypothetical protein
LRILRQIKDLLTGFHWKSKDEPVYLYRCSECGKTYLSIGSVHGHAEGHRPFLSWPGNIGKLMEYTEILEVTSTEKVSLEEIKEKGELQ